MKLSSSLRSLILAAAVAVPALTALAPSFASAAPAAAASASERGKKAKEAKPRVTVDATFERFLLDPRGRIHGLLLKDGSVVRAPEGAVRDTSMKAGDAIKIEARSKGISGVNLYGRALVKKNGAVVVDATQKPTKGAKDKGDAKDKGAKLAELTSTGTISHLLYGRDGAVRGVVLSDGLVAHAGKKAKLDEYKLKKGDSVTVTGKGGSYALGRSVRIESIKLPNGDVKKP